MIIKSNDNNDNYNNNDNKIIIKGNNNKMIIVIMIIIIIRNIKKVRASRRALVKVLAFKIKQIGSDQYVRGPPGWGRDRCPGATQRGTPPAPYTSEK